MMLHLLLLAACCLSAASCANRQSPVEKPVAVQSYCRYQTVSVGSDGIPSRIFLFPPLRCDAKSKPLESLRPVQDGSGAVVDWKAPSKRSNDMLADLRKRIRDAGYEVVGYPDVLGMTTPHSILVVSTFYSDGLAVDPPPEQGADRYLLTMAQANTFDLDLDPANSLNIAKADGVTYFKSSDGRQDLTSRSLAVLIGKMSESTAGFVSFE